MTRLVKVELKEGGAEVVLKKLSKSLDKDSVRVDGIGPASVTEVSFQVLHSSLGMHSAVCVVTALAFNYVSRTMQ